MALQAQAQLLDELMGKFRNVAPGDKVNSTRFDDSDVCERMIAIFFLPHLFLMLLVLFKVCKFHLCGFCPHDLFVNTKADLGLWLGGFFCFGRFVEISSILCLYCDYVFDRTMYEDTRRWSETTVREELALLQARLRRGLRTVLAQSIERRRKEDQTGHGSLETHTNRNQQHGMSQCVWRWFTKSMQNFDLTCLRWLHCKWDRKRLHNWRRKSTLWSNKYADC